MPPLMEDLQLFLYPVQMFCEQFTDLGNLSED